MDIKKILLIGGLGLVAVVGFLQLQKMGQPTAPMVQETQQVVKEISVVDYVDVLVAKRDIPLGSRLTREMIAWKKWPAEALNKTLIDNQSQPDALVKFAGAVSKTAIYKGEPIMNRKVVHPGERGQMSALLKPGMRAIAIRINVETAAGGFIQPGDRVDLVLTTKAPGTAFGQANYVSKTIFENVGVLAIGKVYNNTSEGTAYVSGSTAVLELSQTDAEILTEAQSRGDISLALRGLDRRTGPVPSAAKTRSQRSSAGASVTVYRNGQAKQVAIQGQ